MAKDRDWIKDLYDELIRTANQTEDLAFRDKMREDFVTASIEEMAENGTYRFITSWFGIDDEPDMTIEKDFDPRNEIDDEIKDQFVGDDWKHILPFKWFGK
jgi:hypothetical protein